MVFVRYINVSEFEFMNMFYNKRSITQGTANYSRLRIDSTAYIFTIRGILSWSL
jgi:hypothetical protein